MISNKGKGKIDTILTKEVSRFARNTIDTLSYTRHLKDLKINVIFMNDGIDTNDKDGELRLTIMASIAQEESRKTSERVKWGIRRQMEKGYVYGYSHMLGYRITDGKLEIIPEEAEIVRKIFHKYVFEGKGSSIIANELNAEGYTSARGAIFRQDSIVRILKNEKYCGDLIQWKRYSTDFLSKKVVWNDGTNPDIPLIEQKEHHEPIISREIFEAAQELLEKRGKQSREGRKYSQHYWHSSRVYCGKCGSAFGITGSKNLKNRCLRCINRSKYGTVRKMNVNGVEVGCDNKFITEKIIGTCMKYVLEYVREEREGISGELIEDLNLIRSNAVAIDTKPLQEKIDSIMKKKHSAIDLMLEGIITKDDLKAQVEIYDAEIEKQYFTQNTHEAIVDQNTWEIAKQIRSNRKRITKSGYKSIFSGLVFCADCGSKLTLNNKKGKEEINHYFICSKYRNAKSDKCTTHSISEKVLYEQSLTAIRLVTSIAGSFEDEFKALITESTDKEMKKAAAANQRRLAKATARVKDIRKITRSLYEDKVKGIISEEDFTEMNEDYTKERKALEAEISEFETAISNMKEKTTSADKFIELAKKYTEISELNTEIVNTFIEKIIVHERVKNDGKTT